MEKMKNPKHVEFWKGITSDNMERVLKLYDDVISRVTEINCGSGSWPEIAIAMPWFSYLGIVKV